MKLDLHIHTNSSVDGFSTPSMIIKYAKKRGLSGVAISDHNTLKGIDAVRRIAPTGFFVIPGVEYSTDFGHMLALFCDKSAEDFDKSSEGLYSFIEIADFVHGEAGLLVAAHPLRYKRYLKVGSPYDLNPKMLRKVDGIESINSRDLRRDPAANLIIEKCAMEHGLFLTGGSDAHMPMVIGDGYTEFPECGSLDELKQALVARQTKAFGNPSKRVHIAAQKIMAGSKIAASKVWRSLR